MVTFEVNHNKQDDNGGTIDSKSRAFTKGKEPNVICEGKSHVG